jgi:hypothetical protein
MEGAWSSEKLASYHKTTRSYKPEDFDLKKRPITVFSSSYNLLQALTETIFTASLLGEV